MRCSDLKGHFVDYALGELAPEIEIQVNEHLAVCERCRVEYGPIEETINSLEGARRFAPPPSTFKRITARIPVPRQTYPRFFGIPKSLVFAFGAFFLGIILTRSIDSIIVGSRRKPDIEVRQEMPRKIPFSDTVEFYSVPAKNLART